MIDVDALTVDTVVVPDSQVRLVMPTGVLDHINMRVTVEGAGTSVSFYNGNYVLVGDTVTLATFFEELASAIRGEA